MSYVIGMLVSAAILGVIVAVREGEFHGWGPMCGIALASGGTRWLVEAFIPTPLDLLGTAVGAGIAMLLISWLLESPRRPGAARCASARGTPRRAHQGRGRGRSSGRGVRLGDGNRDVGAAGAEAEAKTYSGHRRIAVRGRPRRIVPGVNKKGAWRQLEGCSS